jgi:hypothetical protein
LTRAVVIGPTSSGFAIRNRAYPWHRGNYEAGMVNFLDGFSVHPYNDAIAAPHDCDRDETRWANLVRDMNNLFKEFYEARPPVGSTEPHARVHEKPFFVGTEQGLRFENSPGGSARLMAQISLRQNVTMKGEGYFSNHKFLFADYFSHGAPAPYGFFYNCTPMQTNEEHFHPGNIAPKKMASGFTAMSLLMKGYRTLGRIADLCNEGDRTAGTTWGYKFEDTWPGNTGSVIYAVWDWEKETPYTLSVIESGTITVIDAMGNPIPSGTRGVTITGRNVSLTLTGDVVFIKVSNE